MSAAARSTTSAVSCRGVRKHFGEGETAIEALRGVDFEARFGELSFLVGPERLRQDDADLGHRRAARSHRRAS